jgi:hypothetical protein
MKDWNSEEEIKAQLRELTEQTRKVRKDLNALIRPSKPLTSGAFIHDRATTRQPVSGEADDRDRPRKPR